MKTFTAPRAFVSNIEYHMQREQSLKNLRLIKIDDPIVDIIHNFSKLSYCFTLQSCFGHFLVHGHEDPQTLKPLSVGEDLGPVEYRIAYLTLCIENSIPGKDPSNRWEISQLMTQNTSNSDQPIGSGKDSPTPLHFRWSRNDLCIGIVVLSITGKRYMSSRLEIASLKLSGSCSVEKSRSRLGGATEKLRILAK